MKFKALLLASTAVVLLPLGAGAADLLPVRMATKAVPIAPAPFSWTGFYVGANVGGIWGRSDQTVDINTGLTFIPANTASLSGLIGGVQAGYNYQVSNIVLGIEADYDWSNAKSSVVTGPNDTHNVALTSLGTIRGRVGVAFDRFLPYVTGGVAFANLQNQLIDTAGPFTVDRGSTATGWTVGGGLEYAIDKHWSAKAEYLYVQLPNKTVSAAIPGGYLFQTTFKDREQIARVGINYRF